MQTTRLSFIGAHSIRLLRRSPTRIQVCRFTLGRDRKARDVLKVLWVIPTVTFGLGCWLVKSKEWTLQASEKGKIIVEVEEAERLYNEYKHKELLEYLLQFAQSEDPELLWRLAQAYWARSVMADVSDQQKKQLIMDGMEVAKRALEFGETNWACHKWYGILLKETGEYLGNKVKISNAYTIKSHFEKAAELNPNNPTVHYLMGMWCFNVANLGYFERKIAQVLFGNPPSSTFEEALTHLLKAEEMSPSFRSDNQLHIGLTYLKIGKKAEAKEWFQKLTNYDAKTDEDQVKIKEAHEQLKFF